LALITPGNKSQKRVYCLAGSTDHAVVAKQWRAGGRAKVAFSSWWPSNFEDSDDERRKAPVAADGRYTGGTVRTNAVSKQVRVIAPRHCGGFHRPGLVIDCIPY